MASEIDELRARFPLPWLSFELGAGDLIKVVVQTSAAAGEFYLHGAHIAHWQPAAQEPVLWMSRASSFDAAKPIRGGVPICFPWFGPHPSDSSAPAHGHARLTKWELTAAERSADGSARLSLTTVLSPFALRFDVEFGPVLRMAMQTTLEAGHENTETFEQALHTYMAVKDVRSVSISGLEGAGYLDKVDGGTVKPATGLPIEFSGETDRVYLDTVADCLLTDHGNGRCIQVCKSGSDSTVIWNPWINKSARMPDFGDHEWPEMVCIETANVGAAAVKLQPGQSHSMTAEISVLPISKR
jgi:glucose-6-phosphate 1-epimerase